MRVRIPALIGTALAAGFAGLAVLSGLDRLAADNPATPALTEWPYARNAPYNVALTAAAGHHWALSEALITRVIAAEPVNEHVIGALGQIRLGAGNTNGADAAFRVSAQRGWRDPATHVYWMKQSIDAADFTAAALHADALLRMPLGVSAHDQILDSLLEYDEGRTALAMRLRGRPSWSNDFVVKLDALSNDALIAHADVANRAGAHAFTCPETAGFINRLVEIKAAKPATDLYHNSCPADPGLIHDSHFRQYFQHVPISQLNWYAPENSQIPPSQIEPSGVSFYSNNDVTQPILAQRLVVSPGLYRLSWDMLDTSDALTKKLLVNLSCSRDIAKARPGEPLGPKSTLRSLQFRLDHICPIPELNFWLTTMDGTIKVDNVMLQKIAGQ